MPEISVVMPCFNTNENLLNECVKSILSQSFADFELIIVDDGSDEGYRNVYKNEIFSDSRIKVILKENGGVSVARNHGLKYVKGRYVVFADSDDVLLPDFFSDAYKVAEKENADIVFGCNMHMNDYSKNKSQKKLSENDILKICGEQIKSLRPNMVGERLRYENGLIYVGRGPWTRLIKSELAKSVLFPEGLPICEDIIWNLKLLEKSSKVCIVKKAWYLYRLDNMSSSTKRYNRNIIKESRAGLNETKKYLDLDNSRELKAFADKSFEELNRIFYGFIGHRDFVGSPKKRRYICRNLYTKKPWNIISDNNYFRLCSLKDKIRVIMYRLHFYFMYLYLKNILVNGRRKRNS